MRPSSATPPIDDAQQRSSGSANGPMIRGIESPRAQVPVSAIDQNSPADLPQGRARGTSGELRYDTGPTMRMSGTIARPALFSRDDHDRPCDAAGRQLCRADIARQRTDDRGRWLARRSYGGSAFTLSPGAAQTARYRRSRGLAGAARHAFGPDQIALRSGRSASPRIDAPDGLLKALRKHLPDEMVLTPPPRRMRR